MSSVLGILRLVGGGILGVAGGVAGLVLEFGRLAVGISLQVLRILQIQQNI